MDFAMILWGKKKINHLLLLISKDWSLRVGVLLQGACVGAVPAGHLPSQKCK